MKNGGKALYLAREFAVRAGVTVRTLHHYDRAGLLRPTGRTGAGYRLYGEVGYTIIDDVLSLPERMPAIYRRLTT